MSLSTKKIPYKILVIDDDSLMRNCLKSMIQSIKSELDLCFDIIEGNDGKDIIDYCENSNNLECFKVIFTDENMINIDGSEAIKHVRKIEKKGTSSTKFVSVSSKYDEEFKQRLIECGANYVLNKPLSKIQLKNTIAEIMSSVRCICDS